jgi:hypothetical protein
MTRIADLRPLRALLLPYWHGEGGTAGHPLETALETNQTVVWDDAGRRHWHTAE